MLSRARGDHPRQGSERLRAAAVNTRSSRRTMAAATPDPVYEAALLKARAAREARRAYDDWNIVKTPDPLQPTFSNYPAWLLAIEAIADHNGATLSHEQGSAPINDLIAANDNRNLAELLRVSIDPALVPVVLVRRNGRKMLANIQDLLPSQASIVEALHEKASSLTPADPDAAAYVAAHAAAHTNIILADPTHPYATLSAYMRRLVTGTADVPKLSFLYYKWIEDCERATGKDILAAGRMIIHVLAPAEAVGAEASMPAPGGRR